MTQSAFQTSAGASRNSVDFTENYRNLRKMIQALKKENGQLVGKEIFGDQGEQPALTKSDMQRLFKMLRRIENQYEKCCNPPIPEALEKSIRTKGSDEWLPWELEAIEKMDTWRSELEERKKKATKMLQQAMEKIKARRRR